MVMIGVATQLWTLKTTLLVGLFNITDLINPPKDEHNAFACWNLIIGFNLSAYKYQMQD
jgi:hypothetical protein